MLRDIVQQLKKSEHVEQEHERQHQQTEIREKSPQKIKINQPGEAALRCPWPLMLAVNGFCQFRCPFSRLRLAPPDQPFPCFQPADSLEPSTVSTQLLHARQQDYGQHSQRNICQPNASRGTELSFASESCAHHRQRVIQTDQQNGKQGSRRPAASSWLRSQRYGHQRKCQARERKRQPALKFDSRLAPVLACFSKQFPRWPFDIAQRPLLIGNQSSHLQRTIALSEVRQ